MIPIPEAQAIGEASARGIGFVSPYLRPRFYPRAFKGAVPST